MLGLGHGTHRYIGLIQVPTEIKTILILQCFFAIISYSRERPQVSFFFGKMLKMSYFKYQSPHQPHNFSLIQFGLLIQSLDGCGKCDVLDLCTSFIKDHVRDDLAEVCLDWGLGFEKKKSLQSSFLAIILA